jgi:hypothetical protein
MTKEREQIEESVTRCVQFLGKESKSVTVDEIERGEHSVAAQEMLYQDLERANFPIGSHAAWEEQHHLVTVLSIAESELTVRVPLNKIQQGGRIPRLRYIKRIVLTYCSILELVRNPFEFFMSTSAEADEEMMLSQISVADLSQSTSTNGANAVFSHLMLPWTIGWLVFCFSSRSSAVDQNSYNAALYHWPHAWDSMEAAIRGTGEEQTVVVPSARLCNHDKSSREHRTASSK